MEYEHLNQLAKKKSSWLWSQENAFKQSRTDLTFNEGEVRLQIRREETDEFIFLRALARLQLEETSKREDIFCEHFAHSKRIIEDTLIQTVILGEEARYNSIVSEESAARHVISDEHILQKRMMRIYQLQAEENKRRKEEIAEFQRQESKRRTLVENIAGQALSFIQLLEMEDFEAIFRKDMENWEIRTRSRLIDWEREETSSLIENSREQDKQKALLLRNQELQRKQFFLQEQMDWKHKDELLSVCQEEEEIRLCVLESQSVERWNCSVERLLDKEIVTRKLIRCDEREFWESLTDRIQVRREHILASLTVRKEEYVSWAIIFNCASEETSRMITTNEENMNRKILNSMYSLIADEILERLTIDVSCSARYCRISDALRADLAEVCTTDLRDQELSDRNMLEHKEDQEYKQLALRSVLLLLQHREILQRTQQISRFLQWWGKWCMQYDEGREETTRPIIEAVRNEEWRVLTAEIALQLENAKEWLSLRDVQVSEGRYRRMLETNEDQLFSVINEGEGIGFHRILEANEVARQLQKEHEFQRLHAELIERDARKLLYKQEARQWAVLDNEIQASEGVIRDAMEKKVAQEDADRQLREESKRQRKQKVLNPGAVKVEAVGGDSQVKSASPFAESDENNRHFFSHPQNAAGSPISNSLALENAEFIRTKVGLRQPRNDPRDCVKHIPLLYGHSSSSVYTHYCRQYEVAVKQTISAALPRSAGDFGIRELRINSSFSGPYADTRQIVVVPSSVNFVDNAILPLLEVARANTGLHTFVLYECGLDSTAVEWVCHALLNHPSITHLDLQKNRFAAAGMACLIYLVSVNPRMVSVLVDDGCGLSHQHQLLNEGLQANLSSRGKRLPALAATMPPPQKTFNNNIHNNINYNSKSTNPYSKSNNDMSFLSSAPVSPIVSNQQQAHRPKGGVASFADTSSALRPLKTM